MAKSKKLEKETKKGMSEDELVNLCMSEFDDSLTLTTQIQTERELSSRYYNSEPFGNEEDGLSKFVSSDVRDAIEWIMPQLVDIFVGGDTPVVFEPENAEDVKDAETESRYTQYVFERQNNGVIVTSIWLKDALMQKNGIVKAWAEKEVRNEREEYQGKTTMEYMALKSDKEFEIKECTIEVGEKEFSEEEYHTILESLPTQAVKIDTEAKYHIIGYRKRNIMKICVDNVPPEQFFIQKDHNSIFIQDARYCGEYYEKTRSELIEMGYDRDLVMMLPASTGVAEVMGQERQQRSKREGGLIVSQNRAGTDKSRELVMIYDHYIRADFNGDDVAEMRHVRTAGRGTEHLLENNEVDRNIYHGITPYINSYRFFGRSVADNLMDLQRMKSQLWRNAMDNIAYSAIPRKVVKGNVDVAALMTYVQGGIIKADLNASVESETTPFVADSALLLADRVDVLRAERSGFSKDTMGLNPSALANSTNPVGMMIMMQSQLLVKMMATIIANSGFKTLVEHLRELILKYEDRDRIFDLTGTFMETDPRRWRKERSSVARVGIGFAGKQEEIAMLDRLLALQEKFVVAQGGSLNGELTNSQGIFNTVKRMCSRMGIKDAKTYFQDPAEYQAPPPQPTLAEKTLQVNTETLRNQHAISEAKLTQDTVKMKSEEEYNLAELQQKERLAMKEMESKERMFEMELLYKYGKDAKESAKIKASKSEGETERSIEVNVGGGGKKARKKEEESLAHIGKIATAMKDGLSQVAHAQSQGSQEIIKAIKRPRKVSKRDAMGRIDEVE